MSIAAEGSVVNGGGFMWRFREFSLPLRFEEVEQLYLHLNLVEWIWIMKAF